MRRRRSPSTTGDVGTMLFQTADRVDAIEGIDPVHRTRPPDIVAVDRWPGCLNAHRRPEVIEPAAGMPYYDFRIMIGREHRRVARTGHIGRSEPVGIGPVVLLKPRATGCERGDRDPGPILRERVLHACEAGGCERIIRAHRESAGAGRRASVRRHAQRPRRGARRHSRLNRRGGGH